MYAHLKAVKFLVYRYGFGTLAQQSVFATVPQTRSTRAFATELYHRASCADASHDGTFSVFVLRTSLEVEKQFEFFFFHCFLLAKLHFFEEL